MSGRIPDLDRAVSVPLDADITDLEFFPLGRDCYLSAASAYDEFEQQRNYLQHYDGFIFLPGPPHIYEERMTFTTRYGWRHWMAIPA